MVKSLPSKYERDVVLNVEGVGDTVTARLSWLHRNQRHVPQGGILKTKWQKI